MRHRSMARWVLSLAGLALLMAGVGVQAAPVTVSCAAAEASDPDTLTAPVGAPTTFGSCFCDGNDLFGNSGAFGNFLIKSNASICAGGGGGGSVDAASARDSQQRALDIFRDRGGTRPTPASRFRPDDESSTAGGGGDDEDREPRFERVPIAPQIRPLSAEERAAIARFEQDIAAAREAVRAAQEAERRLRDQARALNLFRDAASTDIRNDLLNLVVGEALGALGGKLEEAADTLPPGQADALKDALGEALGVTGDALEQTTPDELAGLLSSKLGEDDADAIAEAAINVLTLGGLIPEEQLPGIAGLASRLFDVTKIGSKLIINEIEFDVLFQDFQRARQATADQAAIAIARALAAIDGGGRESALFQAAQGRRAEFARFVAGNDTRTSADGARHNEVAAAFAGAQALARDLADAVAQPVDGGRSVAEIGGLDRGSDTLRQFIGVNVRTGESLASTFSSIIEVSNLDNRPEAIAGFLAQNAASLGVANAALPAKTVKDFEIVEVNDQLAPPDAARAGLVAGVVNLRSYVESGGFVADDRRGGSNIDSRGLHVSAGADTRLSPRLVAGAAIKYSDRDEDDDGAQVDIDSQELSLTPYFTYEFHRGLYLDGYLLFGIGRRSAANPAGASDGATTRSFGIGVGINHDADLAPDLSSSVRAGVDWARVQSDRLAPGGTLVRNASVASPASLSLRGRLQWSQSWGSVSASLDAVHTINSDAPGSVNKLVVIPGLEVVRALPSLGDAEIGLGLSADMLQSRYRSLAGTLRFSLSY